MDSKPIKFERPLRFALAFAALWAALALGTGDRFFYYGGYSWVILMIASMVVHRINAYRLLSQFEIEKTELSAGEAIPIRYRVLNTSIIPAYNVRISPVISKSFGYEQFDSDVHGFDSFEVKVIDRQLICHRRGFYTLGEVSFELRDPLGLMTSRFSKKKEIEVVVRPRIIPMDRELPMPLERSGSRGMSLRQRSDRTSIKSVRDYREGDQVRDIHWKLTAKTGKPVVKEFTQSVSEKIYLFIDGNRSAYEENPLLADDAMDLAASLSHEWLKRGIPVQVIFSDESRTGFSGRNLSALGRFLDHFTAFNPNGWISFEDFLEREIKWHQDGSRWVTITTTLTPRLEQMVHSSRNSQFAWTCYLMGPEGRRQL